MNWRRIRADVSEWGPCARGSFCSVPLCAFGKVVADWAQVRTRQGGILDIDGRVNACSQVVRAVLVNGD